MSRAGVVLKAVLLTTFAFLLGSSLIPEDWFPFLFGGSEITLGVVACIAAVAYGASVGYLCHRILPQVAFLPVGAFVLGCGVLFVNEAYWTLEGLSARLGDLSLLLPAFTALGIQFTRRLTARLDSRPLLRRVTFGLLAFVVGSQFGEAIINSDVIVAGACFGLLAASVFASDRDSAFSSVGCYVVGVAMFGYTARDTYMPIPIGDFDYPSWALDTLSPALAAMLSYFGFKWLWKRLAGDAKAVSAPVQQAHRAERPAAVD